MKKIGGQIFRTSKHTVLPYSRKVWREGKFGEFGESYMIHQTTTNQISYYN